MLVLSRKVGQELVIGDRIRITVNRLGGNRVVLGISAPDEVRIVRGELTPIVQSFDGEDEAPAAEVSGEVAEATDEVEPVPDPFSWGVGDSSSTVEFARHLH